MIRNIDARVALTIALTAVAGCVDAIGYLQLRRHYFVSFMSGDSTKLVVEMMHGDWSAAAGAGAIVALFVVGVVSGRLVCTSLGTRGRTGVLSAEAGLLAMAALLRAPAMPVIALTVAAMGIQNAALDKRLAPRMGLSYVTGTLVSLGDKLADGLRGDRRNRRAWAVHLFHWLGLVLGAACGALAYRPWGISALLLPAAALACIAAAQARG